MDSRTWSILLVIADGMVLGWSDRCDQTLDAGFAVMPAILLGMLTAIGGGMNILPVWRPACLAATTCTPPRPLPASVVGFWHLHQPVLGMGASIIGPRYGHGALAAGAAADPRMDHHSSHVFAAESPAQRQALVWPCGVQNQRLSLQPIPCSPRRCVRRRAQAV